MLLYHNHFLNPSFPILYNCTNVLQNLSSSITKLEYLYKTQIYNALRSDGADIDIDTGDGVAHSHSAKNNLTYEQVCQLPYSTLVKALSTPTSNYKSTSDNKETTDYNLLEGYYAWFDPSA